VLLIAAVLACSTVAAFVGQPVWAAAAGSSLALVYWALEVVAWRSASRGTFNHAVASAVAGAVARMALALVCLVLIGVFARDAFPAAALSFLAAFTVYMTVRIFTFAGEPAPTREAGSR
jgi:hypothetical protein